MPIGNLAFIVPATAANSDRNFTLADIVGNKDDLIFNNSLMSILKSFIGEVTVKEVRVTGTGDLIIPVAQLQGTVKLTEHYAVITSITTLTNATKVNITLYDGTNSIDLTKEGINLSGAPVGTVFVKGQTTNKKYGVAEPDECRLTEVISNNALGLPFAITQKKDTNTYIRLHVSTTDTPVDFTVFMVFRYFSMYTGSSIRYV